MEPSDFDKAIQDKLQQKSGLHQNEMAEAKLALWSQVDANLHKGRPTPWYWLVAAAVLLLMSFSFVMYRIQEGHRQELSSLKSELTQMSQQYELQSWTVAHRDEIVATLEEQLSQMDQKLVASVDQNPPVINDRIVYLRDTVYLTEVQYITETIPPNQSLADERSAGQALPEQNEPITQSTASTPTFIAIASRPTDKKEAQNIKVKFGSFTKKLRNQ